MGEGAGRDASRRLSVSEAALALGVSVDAVRSRIKRGTIAHEREGGRVYVVLGGDESRPGRDQPTDLGSPRPDATNTLISQMQAEIDYLREENRRKDHIIAGLVERIPPQLEAPQEQASYARERRESPVSTGPSGTPTERTGETQEGVQRPWWKRVFGG